MCLPPIVGAGLLGILLAATPAAALQRVYVANISGGTVAVVDADRRAVIGSIAVGRQPDGVAASRDGRTVYVSNFADATVSVIDTARDAVVATIPVDLGPVGIAVSPSGAEVYVACKVAGTLVVIDAAARTVAASIGIGEGPNDVAVLPDGSQVFVTRSAGNTVAIIDSATRRQVDLLQVGRSPNRLVLSADGSQLYVSLFRDREVVRITLAGAEPVRGGTGTRPSGLALSADGRSLYVSAQEREVRRLDAVTLETRDVACGGVAPYGLLALPGGALMVADMGGDLVRVHGAGAAAEIPIDGGPFALAALPPERPALDLAIDSPVAGVRPVAGSALPLRISAGNGTSALRRWTLHLLDDAAAQVLLATGTEPVAAALVATVDAGVLRAGHTYRLVLEGIAADETHLRRTLSFSVPERRAALVPIEPTRSEPYAAGAVMDGAGRRFAAFDSTRFDVAVFDAADATRSHVQPSLFLRSGRAWRLSRDGNRLLLTGRIDGIYTTGLLDLRTAIFSALPFGFDAIDLDAGGQRLATFSYRGDGWNYALTDLSAGSTTAITDLVTQNDLPPTCRPFNVGIPRLSADGNTVAFFTVLPLGGPPGCDLYAYDAHTGTLRYVQGFGAAGPVQAPTMDDAGAQLAVVLPPADSGADGPTRLAHIDLADGTVTPLLADSDAAVLEGVISGDGTSIVFSSCADLDPAVGNPDFNQELFRLDLASGRAAQVTDTRGGPQDCFIRDGELLSPQVSRDASVIAFQGQGFGSLSCGSRGPQRDRHTGLAFGQARAVPIVTANQPPTLVAGEDALLEVGEYFDVAVTASDPDGDALVYFAEVDDLGGLPLAARFFVVPGEPDLQALFQWNAPTPADVGDHALRIGAFDGRGGDAVRTVRLTVCRFRPLDPIGDIVTAIFGAQPVACGSGDANRDGVASAADLLFPR